MSVGLKRVMRQAGALALSAAFLAVAQFVNETVQAQITKANSATNALPAVPESSSQAS